MESRIRSSICESMETGLLCLYFGTSLIANLLVPLKFKSLIFFKYQSHPIKQGLFYGMRPVIVGLILSAAYFMAETSLFIVKPGEWTGNFLSQVDWVSVGIALLTVVGIRKYKLHPILLLGVGGAIRIGLKFVGV